MTTNHVVETPKRPQARREFLKRGVLAGGAVLYAVPLIETLHPGMALASGVSQQPCNSTSFGSPCYICTQTPDLGLCALCSSQHSDWWYTIQSALAAVHSDSALSNSPLYGIDKILLWPGSGNASTFSCVQTTSDLQSYLCASSWSCNRPVPVLQSLFALAILVELNNHNLIYTNNSKHCDAGLGLHVCVNVGTYAGLSSEFGGTKASVGPILQKAIAKASDKSLYKDSGLIKLLGDMTQNISGFGGPYIANGLC